MAELNAGLAAADAADDARRITHRVRKINSLKLTSLQVAG
jgi:hypothetical protein